MAADDLVELRCGAHALALRPAAGGQVAWFRTQLDEGSWWDWLRPSEGEEGDPLRSACFPMTPYCNRIEKGRFTYRGREVRLPANKPPEPHAIHGLGWQSAWSLAARDETSATLSFRHDGGDWPWPFESRFTYRLSEDGLAVACETRNLGAESMPSGLGLHPYFPIASGVRLGADVEALVLTDARMIPTGLDRQDPLIAAFRRGDPLPAGYDNGLEGWGGEARLVWPAAGRALRLRASAPVSRAVFYSPAGESFFCFEPVSHLWNAHNEVIEGAGDGGLVELAPGEVHRIEVTMAAGAA